MTTYYFADNYNSEGHANITGSALGDDSYDGLYPTHTGGLNGPKRTTSGFNFENKAAGDQFLFAIGGRWHITTGTFVSVESNANATVADPLYFGSYDQGVGATGKPWISSAYAGGLPIFLFGSPAGGTAVHGGYTIDGLELDGGAAHTCVSGIAFYASVRNFTVKNCVIHHFSADGGGIRSSPYLTGNYTNTFGQILDNEVYECLFTGWQGCCTDMLIEGNTFRNNGSDSGFHHGIYYGSGQALSSRTVMRHNIVKNNNTGGGTSAGGNLTFRGQLEYTTVESNLVLNETGTYTSASIGISHIEGYDTDEYHNHTVIRGNKIINFPIGINYGIAPGIIIENNLIADLSTGQTATAAGIAGPARADLDPGDAADDAATIRNNTIYIANPRSATVVFRFGSDAGTNININNNAVICGAIESGTPYLFSISETNCAYANISNNFSGGTLLNWHAGHTTLAAFETYYDALGSTSCVNNAENATHGLTIPTSENNWNMVPTSAASPVVDAGSVSLGTKLAVDGYARDATYDIGAFEYGRNP